MRAYKLSQHFTELKSRIAQTLCFFLLCFFVAYYASEEIYVFLAKPLAHDGHKVIYTGLAEVFFTYIKIAAFVGFVATMPVIAFQIYKFISPGLYHDEKRAARVILAASPLLFWIGGLFVFYFVIPKAWQFFLSFEMRDAPVPLLLEARISEYLSLVMQLVIAFGLAFQLPVIFAMLTLTGVVSSTFLQRKRRISIVVNFIIAGIVTPPDVLSQIALALPMVLLYEISIIACKFLENMEQNVRHKVDHR